MSPGKACVTGVDVRVKLPEPDLKNIATLTENLPNVPILPWNRYDSPQEDIAPEKASQVDE